MALKVAAPFWFAPMVTSPGVPLPLRRMRPRRSQWWSRACWAEAERRSPILVALSRVLIGGAHDTHRPPVDGTSTGRSAGARRDLRRDRVRRKRAKAPEDVRYER